MKSKISKQGSRSAPSALVKLTRPQLSAVYARTRLLEQIDQAAAHPMLWVEGPAGAGKTTLAVNWLEARGHDCLWYQVDAGDTDPAAFFHYLGLAVAQAAPRFRRPMPKLTPEYLAGIPTFTRNFFRELARRLNKPCVLVFDNAQELAESAPMYEVLCTGLSELPPHLRTILISRSKPPPAFARMQVSGQLAQLNWGALQLRPEESIQFARFLGQNNAALPVALAPHLHDQCEGWIAGLILLFEGAQAATSAQQAFDPATAEIMFDYFAAEVFARRHPAVKEFLMQTALFPSFTAAMAERMSGNAQAAALLDDLVRSHYFTERRAGPGASYQYHPLFRAFLLAQARETWGLAELARRRHKAASLIEGGRPEEALAFYLDAEDWGAATRLILQHAPMMLTEGRSLTLGEAIRRLPAAELESEPWLPYWLGVCSLPMDPGAALVQFEAAFLHFERDRNATGAFLAWAGAADAITYQMSDYGQFDPWLDRLERLTEAYPKFPSIEIEARVVAAALFACLWRRPAHPSFVRWMQRATTLLRACDNLAACARLAFPWLICGAWYGDDRAEVAEMLEYAGSLAGRLSNAPFEQILIKFAEANWFAFSADAEGAIPPMEAGLTISARTGVHLMDLMLLGVGILACLGAGQLARADELLPRMRAQLDRFGSKFDSAFYWHLRSWRAALSGDFPTAQRNIALSVQLETELKIVTNLSCAILTAALYHVEMGELDSARAALARADTLLRDTPKGHLCYMRDMVGAQLAFADKREAEGCELLGQALRLLRKSGTLNYIGLVPTSAARLCALALERGIEPDCARMFIRKLQLAPPPDIGIAEWPWPIKIYTLGRFSIVRDGAPLQFAKRAQGKVIEMLKTLIALGGRDVDMETLAAALWPEAEGDKANQAFKTTLHRLRKLLGNDEVISVREGHVTLNYRYCWVDVCAFERLLGREPADVAALERAVALYHGHFLAEDTVSSRAMALRERLHVKYLGCLSDLGRQWEETGDWKKAASCYQQGLGVDPLVEEYYQRLMICHQQLGHRAEALSVYRRCRDALRLHLDISPSPETEAIVRSVHESGNRTKRPSDQV